MMDKQAVLSALGPIAEGLAADGTSIEVGQADDDKIVLILHQGQDACADCIIEPESLQAMFAECLRDAGLHTKNVDVRISDVLAK